MKTDNKDMVNQSLSLEELAILVFELIRVKKVTAVTAAKHIIPGGCFKQDLDLVVNLLEAYKTTHTGLETISKEIKNIRDKAKTSPVTLWEEIIIGGHYVFNYKPVDGIIHQFPWNTKVSEKVQVENVTQSQAVLLSFLYPPVLTMYNTFVYKDMPPSFKYGSTWWLEVY